MTIAFRPNEIFTSARSRARALPPLSSTEISIQELWRLFFLLTCMFGVEFVSGLNVSSTILGIANLVAPLVMSSVLIVSVVGNLRNDPMKIWGAITWFRVACVAYYGLGAIVPLISNEATKEALREIYNGSDAEALKVNTLNLICILIVLSVNTIMTRYFIKSEINFNKSTKIDKVDYRLITIVFLIIGGVMRYGIQIPSLFGFGVGDIPSFVTLASKFYSSGIFFLIRQSLQKKSSMIVVGMVLVTVEVIFGILLFNKTDVLVTVLLTTLAFFQARPRLKRLLIAGMIVGVIYTTLVPIVEYGRIKVIQEGGGTQIATGSQRLQIVADYASGDRLGTQLDDVQTSLMRLSLFNIEELIVHWHDGGHPVPTLDNLFSALVPRFLWPNKPNIAQVGTDLYTRMTGNTGVSVTSGIFAESYGNFGWLGVPLLMIPMGAILTLLGHLSVSLMREERLIYLPFVLFTVLIGCRPDGAFVIDMVGGALTACVLYVLTRFLEPVVTKSA